MDTFGIATAGATTTLTDTTKNWSVNKWAGNRLVYNSGTGQRLEVTIISNTATVLTFGTTTAPDTTTCYTILGISFRSTGICLRWLYGNSDVNTRGNYLISPRGGNTNTLDRYNIVKDKWELSFLYTPQSELLNTGSSYCYDGVDTFYFTVSIASDFIYVFSLNVSTMLVNGAFQSTVLQGTIHNGNIMEIVNSPDGGKFLFLGICSSRLMYKTMIY